MKKLKVFLYKIYSMLKFQLGVLKWSYDTWVLRNVIKKKDREEKIIGGKILVLIPHADDEWVGCSQLLMNKDLEVILFNMDMQGGDTVELHAHRREELQSIADLCERKLITSGENKEQLLKECVDEIHPDIVCVPYYFDWHPEHVKVMNHLFWVMNHTEYKGRIMMYQVSLPILPEECNYWIPMSKGQWKQKWMHFEDVYLSQITIPYKRFSSNERINGAICGNYAAEVFRIETVGNWKAKLSQYQLNSEETKELKASLMDIAKTRRILSSILESRKVVNI